MMPKLIVELVSGGPDSITLLYDHVSEGCKVHAAIGEYGQRHVQETIWAKHHCHRLGVLFTTFNIQQLRGSELTDGVGGVIVPFRNAILLSLAINLAVSAGAETVTFAANKDDADMFPDCRKEFVLAFNNTLRAAEIPVEVCAPYIDWPKWKVLAHGQELGVRLEETWSCYRGGKKPCGKCEACKKRLAAMNRLQQCA